MKDYAKELVDIKGKKYQPVASRLSMALDAPPEIVARVKGSLLKSCTTEVLYNTEKFLGVKVTLILKEEYGGGIFDGVAESDRAARSIEGDNPLEVAETSALGRALAKAGILIDLSVAPFPSHDEMRNGEAKTAARQRPPVNMNPETGEIPAPIQMSNPLNERQLLAIYTIGKVTGELTEDAVNKLCQELYHTEVKKLTRQDAARFIDILRQPRQTNEEKLFTPDPIPANAVNEGKYVCEDCDNNLVGFTTDGRYYSTDDLADSRRKRYGKILCTPCVRKKRAESDARGGK